MLNHSTQDLLRLPQVLKIIPVSRSTWYLGVKKGAYPSLVKIGRRASGWRRRDVEKLAAHFTSSWNEAARFDAAGDRP